jgi:hypothetical protein
VRPRKRWRSPLDPRWHEDQAESEAPVQPEASPVLHPLSLVYAAATIEALEKLLEALVLGKPALGSPKHPQLRGSPVSVCGVRSAPLTA